MELGKISSRGQTTIPKSIRDALNMQDGDTLAFEIEGDHVILRRVVPGQDDYLRGLSRVLGEWTSPEDEAAWHDL